MINILFGFVVAIFSFLIVSPFIFAWKLLTFVFEIIKLILPKILEVTIKLLCWIGGGIVLGVILLIDFFSERKKAKTKKSNAKTKSKRKR